MKRICTGWPAEYAGPRAILGDGHISWASRPRVIEMNDGTWRWECTPVFLRNEAFNDLARLTAEGWQVMIRSQGEHTRVQIWEQES